MTIRDDKLVHEILKNDGITLDTNTNQTITDTTGYMVSFDTCEESHSIRVFTKVGRILLERYIEKYRHILREPEHFLGVWVDGNTVYFDVSQRIVNRETAIFLGITRNQLAIYGLENQEVIMINQKL